jgi:hypothetical protein
MNAELLFVVSARPPIQHDLRGVFNRHQVYFLKATNPCAVAYGCARIRRLVRLGPGLYRFRVAANSASGFDRLTQSRRTSAQEKLPAFLRWLCVGHLRVCRIP